MIAEAVVNRVAETIERRWKDAAGVVGRGDERVRVLLYGLCHLEITVGEPPLARLSGWDRDLSDLLPTTTPDLHELSGFLDATDAAVRGVLPIHDSHPDAVSASAHPNPAGGWRFRADEALAARSARERGRNPHPRLTPDELADAIGRMWPGVEAHRATDVAGRATFWLRPTHANRVTVATGARSGISGGAVADGELLARVEGRQLQTDGDDASVQAMLATLDRWLRRTTPGPGILVRPIRGQP